MHAFLAKHELIVFNKRYNVEKYEINIYSIRSGI